MSGRRTKRASSAYVAYPVVVHNPGALDRLGVAYGHVDTGVHGRAKLVMSREDWVTVMAQASEAITFVGRTWRTNPTIARPISLSPANQPVHQLT